MHEVLRPIIALFVIVYSYDILVHSKHEQEHLQILPNGLPPLRGIEHQINLILGALIPNKPAYKFNPQEANELQKQVSELLAKGFVR